VAGSIDIVADLFVCTVQLSDKLSDCPTDVRVAIRASLTSSELVPSKVEQYTPTGPCFNHCQGSSAFPFASPPRTKYPEILPRSSLELPGSLPWLASKLTIHPVGRSVQQPQAYFRSRISDRRLIYILPTMTCNKSLRTSLAL